MKELDEEKSENFHSVAVKTIFLTKRARPDIETLGLHATMVSTIDEYDWNKLRRFRVWIKTLLMIKGLLVHKY